MSGTTKLEELATACAALRAQCSNLEKTLVLADAQFRKQFPERYAVHSKHRIWLRAPAGVKACCALEVQDDLGAACRALGIELNVDDLRRLRDWIDELLVPDSAGQAEGQ